MGTAQGGFVRRIRMALMRYCTPRLLNSSKKCGHGARNFCTYLEGAGCNSELTPYESRGGKCSEARPRAPRAVCLNRQLKSPRVAKGNGVGASVLLQEMSVCVLVALWLKTRSPQSTSLGCAFIAT